jgi:hypothetical protein
MRTLIKSTLETKDDMIVTIKSDYMLTKILGTDLYLFKITIDIDDLPEKSVSVLEFINVSIVRNDEKVNSMTKNSLKIQLSKLKSTYKKLTNIAQYEDEIDKKNEH